MKAVSTDTIEIGDARYSRQQLENALRMLDNYQPPAPEFKAGDIIERISNGIIGEQFLVIGGYFQQNLSTFYKEFYSKTGLAFTDGQHTWSEQNPENYHKVGSLGDI